MGKSFTVDPISKRRLENIGEEDQYYIKDHHEPIVSAEQFDIAQQIRKKRAQPYTAQHKAEPGNREKYSRKYAFSCMLECGFCGSNLSRRAWHSGTKHSKTIWQCVTNTKKGKRFCPDSKGVSEKHIENAFVESYRLLCSDNKDVLEEFIQRVENTLSESNIKNKIEKIDRNITIIENKKKNLLDLRLENEIDNITYKEKILELDAKLTELLEERKAFEKKREEEKNLHSRAMEFKKLLEKNQVLEEFDRAVFESIVEKVIVGDVDENGRKDPYKLTFVYKTGMSNKIDAKEKQNLKLGETMKNNINKLCSHVRDEVKNVSSRCIDARCWYGSSHCYVFSCFIFVIYKKALFSR